MTENKNTQVTYGDLSYDAIYDNSVDENTYGSGRWQEYVTTVVYHEGKYYNVNWSRGLTESQENDYPDDSEVLTEVFKTVNVIVRAQTQYLSSDELSKTGSDSIVSEEDVNSLKILVDPVKVDDEISALASLKEEAANVLAVLGGISVLDNIPDLYAYKVATQKLMEQIKAL